jgi:hypothetical protein
MRRRFLAAILSLLFVVGVIDQACAFGLGKEGIVFSRGGKPGSGNRTARILSSGTTFAPNSATGTVIGTLSVLNGIAGTYTFTFTSNPGVLFQIVGSSLQVASGTIGAGSYPVIIHAVNGASIIDTPFTLVAQAACSVTGQMDFSVCSNVAITAAVMP